MDALRLLEEFIRIPGPPGQEEAVAQAVAVQAQKLGFTPETDPKGNVLVRLGAGRPRVVVTAHLDEIAMLVREVLPDGRLAVHPMGGLYAWKCGEGPVDVLARDRVISGVLGFGSIHTDDPASNVQQAREKPLGWHMATVFCGLSHEELMGAGVRPGTRVVLGEARRRLMQFGDYVAGHFLDDRADLVAWLLALEQLGECSGEVLFAATAAEEVGGEGALYLLHELRPEVCIALELGPIVSDAPAQLTASPTVWTRDGYAAMASGDIDLVERVGQGLGMNLQYQAFSRGGSDASCAASKGLCARPITLGLPMENSHGYEVMHRGAMDELARLTTALVRTLL